ncbi:MAG: hypothetical protein K9K64_11240 [Desulfohalobiaceae bacterium]|nr:hypothetical protein [Desulfohalobiaceae bacterium]
MVNPSVLIAGWVAALYLILGPLVLFGFYSFFDYLSQKKEPRIRKRSGYFEGVDPALWTEQEAGQFLRAESRDGK